MVPGFWHKHSTKAFVLLFILLAVLILFLDIEASGVFGFTFEEEILFPAIGILFLASGLLVLKKRVAGKSDMLAEWRKMGTASKFFGLLSFFFIAVSFILAIFQDLFSPNPSILIITEERVVAIVMLASILVFIYIRSNEILAVE